MTFVYAGIKYWLDEDGDDDDENDDYDVEGVNAKPN